MFKRLRNLWELGRYKQEEGVLKLDIKPKPRPATVVKDDPIDLFPSEEPELT